MEEIPKLIEHRNLPIWEEFDTVQLYVVTHVVNFVDI